MDTNGPVYGVAEMTDSLTILDPVTHRASVVKVPSEAPPVVGGFQRVPDPLAALRRERLGASGRRAQLRRRRHRPRVDGVASA